jgi:hypothetical protein
MGDDLTRYREIVTAKIDRGRLVEALARVKNNRQKAGTSPEIAGNPAVDQRDEGIEASVFVFAHPGRRGEDDGLTIGSKTKMRSDAEQIVTDDSVIDQSGKISLKQQPLTVNIGGEVSGALHLLLIRIVLFCAVRQRNLRITLPLVQYRKYSLHCQRRQSQSPADSVLHLSV